MSEDAQASSSESGSYRPGYEVVAEQILELLVADGLRPGDFLGTETQLAQRLGVSRTVVREAAKALAAIGRVRPRKGKGLYVADQGGLAAAIDFFLPAQLDHVLMLFEFRRVQEEEAAVRLAAARATPLSLRAIRELVEKNCAAAKANDVEAFNRSDEAFHHALAEASNNRLLAAAADLARRLQHQVDLIGLHDTRATTTTVAADEHRRIAEAVACGDADTAAAVIGEHLDRTRDHVQQLLMHFLKTGQPATARHDTMTSTTSRSSGLRRLRPRSMLLGTGDNAGVTTYVDEAVVLRTQQLGEADRIITFLTRRHGRVRAVAKGVRRTTSRFGARLEPCSHVDVQIAATPTARL